MDTVPGTKVHPERMARPRVVCAASICTHRSRSPAASRAACSVQTGSRPDCTARLGPGCQFSS